MAPIVNIAGYQFVTLNELEAWRTKAKNFCEGQPLKGTLVFSPEGINIMLAGADSAIRAFEAWIRSFPEFSRLEFKYSYSEFVPFKRMYVKIKPMLVPGSTHPLKETAPTLNPHELKAWYESGKDFVIIDTRNDYELEFGKFSQAIKLDLQEFKHFEEALRALDPALKAKPAVFYCTGGIRCEKAAPMAQKAGFREVYQLEGGILNYFKECGGAHYEGACYVFDERRALTPEFKASLQQKA